ncbi:MAG TPA: thioredoxin domain-containing protein [Myxococcota bacterium]|nr:thioredoxin domain-containing protein [Myxococcota bacterium]
MNRAITVATLCFTICNPTIAGQPTREGFPWERAKNVKASDFKDSFLDAVAMMLNEVPCYGHCSETVAACLKKDTRHTTAARLARDVLLLMAQDTKKDKVLDWVDKRKRMAHPEETHTFSLAKLTPLGPADAKVVIVEFSDFQCPFCAQVAPMLEKIIRESAGKACLYFKQFPIKGHPRSLPASKACVAAGKFGKFWQYCGKLFEHRLDLSDDALLELAAGCGIEKAAFVKQMNLDEVIDRIADEKMEGLRARIHGTPTLFINGKEVLLQPTLPLIRDLIEEELDILDGQD